MREAVISQVEKHKVIAIVRGVKKEDLIPTAEAVLRGGVHLLEITFSANGNPTDEETAENIKMLCDHFGERMLIGAGTVLTEKQVELVRWAGGKFVISPDTNPAVIKKTVELGLVSMPGALTPTEVQSAHLAGADFVKLFPVSVFGASYVKAIKAPLSHVKLLAVGGVTPDNIKSYLEAGASGFGIGANIIDRKLIEAGDFEGIEALARRYSEASN